MLNLLTMIFKAPFYVAHLPHKKPSICTISQYLFGGYCLFIYHAISRFPSMTYYTALKFRGEYE